MWKIFGRYFKYNNREEFMKALNSPSAHFNIYEVPDSINLSQEEWGNYHVPSLTFYDDSVDWEGLDLCIEEKLKATQQNKDCFIKMHHPYYCIYVDS